jgi:predicted N-acetyltransferase YhbS
MPRYYFHIKDEAKTIRNEEGIEFHNLDAVREEATESARQLMSEEVREGHGPDGRVFVVTDEQGKTVLTVPFKDALRD